MTFIENIECSFIFNKNIPENTLPKYERAVLFNDKDTMKKLPGPPDRPPDILLIY